MKKLKEVFSLIFSTIPQSRTAILGVIMATVLFPVLLIAMVLDWQGGIENPYFSFLFYLVLGPLFILGLLLIMLGLFALKSKGDIGLFTYEYLKDQFSKTGRFSRVRRLIYLTTFLTAFFLFIVVVTSYTGFQYTDSVSFCAKFCHTVMEPEFISYKNSPHSQVPCVDCHIGRSAEWLTRAKITGIKQLFSVLTDSYSRPINTPLTGLRPSKESCKECHRPEMFHGHKLYFIDRYLEDETNSHVQTILIMKVGYGGHLGKAAHGIHWHTSEQHQVVYTTIDDQREQIVKVMLINQEGEPSTFIKKGYEKIDAGIEGQRTDWNSQDYIMDCIDCHNRPTHVFRSPEEALDHKFFNKELPEHLPYLKKVALQAITGNYKSVTEAQAAIEKELKHWYRSKYPELFAKERDVIARAIAGVQQAYAENVYPAMKVGWNTYKDHISHNGGAGCFRCHDDTFIGPEGKSISKECTTCHVVLAENRPVGDIMRLVSERYM